MLFVVDVGNSHTVVGLFSGNTLLGHWRIKSDPDQTPDELAIRYHSLLRISGIEKTKIKGVIIASVVPVLEAAWLACCEKHFSNHLYSRPFVVSSDSLDGMVKITTQYPDEVGADRLVNAIAAWHQFRNDLIVIDFGTAITFDCITKECEYTGGAILPGVGISLKALSSNTAKLPHIDITTAPKSVIGKTTVEAMKSGVLFGYGSLIDGLVHRLGMELSPDNTKVATLATGGMAELILPYSEIVTKADPLLTLKGLQIIYSHFHENT